MTRFSTVLSSTHSNLNFSKALKSGRGNSQHLHPTILNILGDLGFMPRLTH